jgi:DNA segregation ATPase FtsK/SpoIIIE-like protein
MVGCEIFDRCVPAGLSLGLSYIHRRLQIGYNRAASLMARMDRRHFRSDESGQVGEEAADTEIKLAFAATCTEKIISGHPNRSKSGRQLNGMTR